MNSTTIPTERQKKAVKPGAKNSPLTQTPASDAKKEVLFELKNNTAKEVLLAGDFTGWERTPIKLNRSEQGAWIAKVKLAPGQYHYKFLVDGKWQDDPRASATCPNPFGTHNCVLKIS